MSVTAGSIQVIILAVAVPKYLNRHPNLVVIDPYGDGIDGQSFFLVGVPSGSRPIVVSMLPNASSQLRRRSTVTHANVGPFG